MKRRSFLAGTATGFVATAALPLAQTAATPRAAFWARYLTSLHGTVPASQIAAFSGSTIAAASQAQTALNASKTLSRAARWLSEGPLDSEDDAA